MRYTKEYIQKLKNLILNNAELDKKIELTGNNFKMVCDIEMEQFDMACEDLAEYFEPKEVFMFFKMTDFYIIYQTFELTKFYLDKLKKDKESQELIFLFFLEMLVQFHLDFLDMTNFDRERCASDSKYSEKIEDLKADFYLVAEEQ